MYESKFSRLVAGLESAINDMNAGIDVPEERVNELVNETVQTVNSLSDVQEIGQEIGERGVISTADVRRIEDMAPGIISDQMDTNVFTMNPSQAGLEPALNAIDWKKVGKFGIIAAIIAAIVALIAKLRGKKEQTKNPLEAIQKLDEDSKKKLEAVVDHELRQLYKNVVEKQATRLESAAAKIPEPPKVTPYKYEQPKQDLYVGFEKTKNFKRSLEFLNKHAAEGTTIKADQIYDACKSIEDQIEKVFDRDKWGDLSHRRDIGKLTFRFQDDKSLWQHSLLGPLWLTLSEERRLQAAMFALMMTTRSHGIESIKLIHPYEINRGLDRMEETIEAAQASIDGILKAQTAADVNSEFQKTYKISNYSMALKEIYQNGAFGLTDVRDEIANYDRDFETEFMTRARKIASGDTAEISSAYNQPAFQSQAGIDNAYKNLDSYDNALKAVEKVKPEVEKMVNDLRKKAEGVPFSNTNDLPHKMAKKHLLEWANALELCVLNESQRIMLASTVCRKQLDHVANGIGAYQHVLSMLPSFLRCVINDIENSQKGVE